MICRTFSRWVIAWCALALSVSAADAIRRVSGPEVRKQVVAVIDAQLKAFRKGEVEKAHALAAAELRAQKPLREFAAIVQGSYPEIWSSSRAEYGIVRANDKQATVTVHVYSKESDAAYDYTLNKESAGWRIYGVVRHEPKKTGKV